MSGFQSSEPLHISLYVVAVRIYKISQEKLLPKEPARENSSKSTEALSLRSDRPGFLSFIHSFNIYRLSALFVFRYAFRHGAYAEVG